MSQTITVFAGFDGTGNNKYNDERMKDGSQTNVANLFNLYDIPKSQKLYERGVGTGMSEETDLTDEQIKLIKEGNTGIGGQGQCRLVKPLNPPKNIA